MVYVMSDGTGYSKIGFAKDWRSRLGTLQIGNPRTITVQMLIDTHGNDKEAEQKLHELYADSRQVKHNGVPSEWFSTDGITDLLKSTSWELNKMLFGEEFIKPWTAKIVYPPQGESIREVLDDRTCAYLEKDGVFTAKDLQILVNKAKFLPTGVGNVRWERIKSAARGG